MLSKRICVMTYLCAVTRECTFSPSVKISLSPTLGSDAREPELCVVIVSTVVIPRPTRAGAASILIQKEIQDRMTIRRLGMYIWIK